MRSTDPEARSVISRIERRAIEAQAVAPIIRVLEKRIGREDAIALLTEVNQQEAFSRGRAVADETDRNSLDMLAEDVATWGEGGSMEVEVLEHTTARFTFNVTRCPYLERYRELGLEDLGVALSCCRDEPFARGLDPRLRLNRSQTLMEGGDFCDFRYLLTRD